MQSTESCVVTGCSNKFHGRGMCRSHYMMWWRGQMEAPEWTPPVPPSKRERFMAKVDKTTSEHGCWLWTASKYNTGYGQFSFEPAHRYSFREFVGPIPDGFVIDHLCMTRTCVNPEHLEAVTQRVNVQRSYVGNVAAARIIAESLARTHCVHGHEMTEENTYRSPSQPTWRVCRKCTAIKDRAHKQRKKDKRVSTQ